MSFICKITQKYFSLHFTRVHINYFWPTFREKKKCCDSHVWLFKHSSLKNMNSFLRHTFKYRKTKHSFLGVWSVLLQITKLSFYGKCYHLKNSKNVNGPKSLLSVSWIVQLSVFTSHSPADKVWDYTGIRWGFQ